VEWSARRDKRNFIESLASETEEATERRENLVQFTRSLNSVVVATLTTACQQKKRRGRL